MRTLIVRGTLITFFAITALFGSAATVQFDGMSASVQTNSASARMHTLVCTPEGIATLPQDGTLRGRCDVDLDQP